MGASPSPIPSEDVDALRAEIVSLRQDLEDANNRVNVVTRLVALGTRGNGERGNQGPMAVTFSEAPRVRVPEPRAYKGARDAKELDNFFFDME